MRLVTATDPVDDHRMLWYLILYQWQYGYAGSASPKAKYYTRSAQVYGQRQQILLT